MTYKYNTSLGVKMSMLIIMTRVRPHFLSLNCQLPSGSSCSIGHQLAIPRLLSRRPASASPSGLSPQPANGELSNYNLSHPRGAPQTAVKLFPLTFPTQLIDSKQNKFMADFASYFCRIVIIVMRSSRHDRRQGHSAPGVPRSPKSSEIAPNWPVLIEF